MVNINSAIAAALTPIVVATANSDILSRRQAGTADIISVTYGGNKYSKKQVKETTAEGYRLHDTGKQIGNNKYPHRFNNRKKLVFAASGPYQEFPILTTGNYTRLKFQVYFLRGLYWSFLDG